MKNNTVKNEEILREREALLEMYKAGFLDGYSTWKKIQTDDDWITLNKFYKMDFYKRFGKKITKILNNKSKEVKNK